jgi:hypothetical protein
MLPRTPSTITVDPTLDAASAAEALGWKYEDLMPESRPVRNPTRRALSMLPLEDRKANVLSRQMQKGADRQMRMRYKRGSMPLSHFLMQRDPRSYVAQQQMEAQQALANQARADQQEQLMWNRENMFPMQQRQQEANLAAQLQRTQQQEQLFGERLTPDQRLAQQNKQLLMSLLGPSLQGLMASENPMAGMQMLANLGRSPFMKGLFGDAWPGDINAPAGDSVDPSTAATMLPANVMQSLTGIAGYGGESEWGSIGQGVQDVMRGLGGWFGGPGAARSNRAAYMGRKLREQIAQGFITPENLPYASAHFGSQIPIDMRNAILDMPATNSDIAVLQSILRGEMP